MVLPSGAGKTVCALRVTEALGSQLTLVLVPSIELVSQTYREWERWREQGALDGWRPLAVVSSSSVPTLPRTTKVDEIDPNPGLAEAVDDPIARLGHPPPRRRVGLGDPE